MGISIAFSLVADGRSDFDRAEFDQGLARAFLLEFFEPAAGVYAELATSGSVGIITDESLRASLAQWGVQLNWLRRSEGYLTAQWNNEVSVYLRNRASLASYLGDQGRAISAPAFEHDYDKLLGSREFHNVIVKRLLYLNYLVGNHETMLEVVADILEAIAD